MEYNVLTIVNILSLSLAILTSAFFISFLMKKKKEIKSEQYLFSFFKLRDKLAYLVIDGKLKQNTMVYKFLIHNINRNISSLEDTDLLNYIINYIELNSNQKYINDLTEIVNSCKNYSQEISSIMKEFEKTTYDIIIDNSKILIIASYLLYTIFTLFKHIPNFIRKIIKIREVTQMQKERIENYI